LVASRYSRYLTAATCRRSAVRATWDRQRAWSRIADAWRATSRRRLRRSSRRRAYGATARAAATPGGGGAAAALRGGLRRAASAAVCSDRRAGGAGLAAPRGDALRSSPGARRGRRAGLPSNPWAVGTTVSTLGGAASLGGFFVAASNWPRGARRPKPATEPGEPVGALLRRAWEAVPLWFFDSKL